MKFVSNRESRGSTTVIRRARTRAAIERLRASAKASGVDKLTTKDIDAEIATARRARRTRR